jgi:murein DD-endopeptidase MepM/ murein hydrolase activator NlpD
MKRLLIVILFFNTSLFGAEVLESRWRDGETFSDYLIRKGVPLSLIGKIPADDIEYLSEIQSGERFYELKDGDRLLQALIPIGEEMQIEIVQNLKTKKYQFDIKPILYKDIKGSVVVELKKNCYLDIYHLTNNPTLNYILKKMYKNVLNFRYLRAGDKIAFEYKQKSRLGKPWGTPKISGAVIKTRGKNHFIFVDKSGNFWESTFREVNSTKVKKSVIGEEERVVKRFVMPLRRVSVSSKFTYKRWHPILHRYRPHLGVDLRGRRGTEIFAINDGRVIYAGWMGGYGKVIKIDHGGGYISLYAHQSRIRVKKGSFVKKGQVIGYVGNTGKSTGPHLHLGVYKNGRAINPLTVIKNGAIKRKFYKKRVTFVKSVKVKKVPIKGAKRLKKRLLKLIQKGERTDYHWELIKKNFVLIDSKKRDTYVK